MKGEVTEQFTRQCEVGLRVLACDAVVELRPRMANRTTLQLSRNHCCVNFFEECR